MSRLARRSAFSLVELLVVVGIVAIVAGLIAPAAQRALREARLTRDLALLRSHAASLAHYAADHDDTYPLRGETRCGAAWRWYQPLVDAGVFASPSDADPENFTRHQQNRFWISQSLVADPIEFQWGWTRPCNESPASLVRQSQVAYPSLKGMQSQVFEDSGHLPSRWFCCALPWRAPVTFCDASGTLGTFLNFVPAGGNPVVHSEHAVGMPIHSPWNGYHARER